MLLPPKNTISFLTRCVAHSPFIFLHRVLTVLIEVIWYKCKDGVLYSMQIGPLTRGLFQVEGFES
jgi:hypothetical protein